MTHTEQEWKAAKDHLDDMYNRYVDLLHNTSINAAYAIQRMNFLYELYYAGDLSDELYNEIMELE
jgi:hypothetical protein